MLDGQFRPIPQADALGHEPVHLVSHDGQSALSVISNAQAKLKPFVAIPDYMLDPRDLDVLRHHSTYLHVRNDSFQPRLEFGNLDNSETPSVITLMEARLNYPIVGKYPVGPATPDGVRLEYGRQLLFGKDISIELLKVKPGEKVIVSGEGTLREYSEMRSRHDELAGDSTVNFDNSTRVELTFKLSLSANSRRVDFRYISEETGDQELTFEKGGILRAPRYSYRFVPRVKVI